MFQDDGVSERIWGMGATTKRALSKRRSSVMIGKVASSGVTQHVHKAGDPSVPTPIYSPSSQTISPLRLPDGVWSMGPDRSLHWIISPDCLLGVMNSLTMMKACKNKHEMEGMKLVHQREVIALHFFAWLEHTVLVERRKMSELEIDEVFT